MAVFWAVLAAVIAGCVATGWRTLRQVRRHPSWRPGDGLPDVPDDAAIRDVRG